MLWRVLAVTLIVAGTAFGQSIPSFVSDMNKALDKNMNNGSVGSVELVDGHILHFSLSVPGPEIALPVGGGPTVESTKWSAVALDLVSITADLRSLNEDAITEKPVFSADGVSNYRLGDVGDMIVVEFNSSGEPSIAVTTVDRTQLAKLQPGKATAEQLGAVSKKTTGAALVFADRNSARAFEKALRVAIVLAKAP